jgi:hypothetical protein
VSDYSHERLNLREHFAFCLRGLWWGVTIALGRARVPRCHDWCECCSPSFCVRCGAKGPYE